MNEKLLQKFGFPPSTYLGTRIFKKLFVENATLTTTDKKSLKDDVDTIVWKYTLKPSTIQIKPYTDKLREYLEIAVLEITLRSPRNYKRLAEVIHRAIPYPLLLIFLQNSETRNEGLEDRNSSEDTSSETESKIALSVAPKRFSQAEKGAFVVEEFFTTDWIDLENPSYNEEAFLDSLHLSSLPHTNFLALYRALEDRFIALDCSFFSGEFRLNSGTLFPDARQKQLATCHELNRKITELQAAIRKETQFNRKLELNVRVKELEKQLKKESRSL